MIAFGVGLAILAKPLRAQGLAGDGALSCGQAYQVALALRWEGALTAAELEALPGPLALFPDGELSNELVAATFPLDVVNAGRFVGDFQDNRIKGAPKPP